MIYTVLYLLKKMISIAILNWEVTSVSPSIHWDHHYPTETLGNMGNNKDRDRDHHISK